MFNGLLGSRTAVFNAEVRVPPFGLRGLGGGYYAASGDVKPDSELGGFILGGVGFKLFGLGASAEARYLMLEPGAADMSGFGANIGITLPL